MPHVLWVFLGAGLGGSLRHLINLALPSPVASTFPMATLLINLLGSLLMGLLAGYFMGPTTLGPHWKLFLTTGVLGGFTTFSTFSLEAVLLWQRGRLDQAAAYVGMSVTGGVMALLGGLWLARRLLG